MKYQNAGSRVVSQFGDLMRKVKTTSGGSWFGWKTNNVDEKATMPDRMATGDIIFNLDGALLLKGIVFIQRSGLRADREATIHVAETVPATPTK
jgi:hypothetical protein